MNPLTLTVTTGLELTGLLVALWISLILIRRLLESIAGSLDRIAWGVRAIETETSALPVGIDHLNAGLSAVSDGLRKTATSFVSADGHLQRFSAAKGVR